MLPLVVYETAFLTTLLLLPYLFLQSCLFQYAVGIIVLYCVLRVIRTRMREIIDPAGKAVLISGCDSGFGLETAKYLCQRGFRVFAGCLNPDGIGATSLKNMGDKNVLVVPLDITQAESVNKALELVRDNLEDHHLWGLVNNAGIASYGDFELNSIGTLKGIFEVNFFGTMRLTKAILPLIREAKGRIVMLSSTAGYLAMPGYSCYSGSKAALESLSDCLRIEMMKFGVKVSILEPGGFLNSTNIMSEENVRRISEEIEKNWEGSSDDVKHVYSKAYCLNSFSSVVEIGKQMSGKSATPVVRAIEKCLTSSDPEYRQLIQADKLIDPSTVIISILGRLPEKISDWALSKMFNQSDQKLMQANNS